MKTPFIDVTALPFPRGKTWYTSTGKAVPGSIDASTSWLEGLEVLVADTVNGTGIPITLRVVRNVSGVILYPKRLVTYQAGYHGRRADGYSCVTNAHGYPVDDAYGATGVANGDLFYVVVEGPCQIFTSTTAGTLNVITERDPLVSCTAAASTGATTTDEGRVSTAVLAGASTNLDTTILAAIRGIFGTAMAAATTSQTNTSILAYVTKTF